MNIKHFFKKNKFKLLPLLVFMVGSMTDKTQGDISLICYLLLDFTELS